MRFQKRSGVRRPARAPRLALGLALAPLIAAAAAGVSFEDGDRVLFLGNTVIERAGESEYIEAMLTAALAPKAVTFRNLGWSGDTVFGTARSYFGGPEEGIERLGAQVREWKPSVIVVCYGAVAAFEGQEGLAEFLRGYRSLLDMLQKESGARAIVLVSPPPMENLGPPLPDPGEQNGRLALYAGAIGALAAERRHGFIDLFNMMGAGAAPVPDSPLTENGLHYLPGGYRVIAGHFCEALGLEPPAPSEKFEALRRAIAAKNRLLFHRWRPANETYIFGFRKHEQGRNAREIPMFDPLIAAKEKEIGEMAKGLADE